MPKKENRYAYPSGGKPFTNAVDRGMKYRVSGRRSIDTERGFIHALPVCNTLLGRRGGGFDSAPRRPSR
jgi:hypothetical protein